ncbi:aldo/keto reductase [Coralloluteibacterium stylophorae]|uniref:Aldo/keto reductase n=1 Tax=Coralloluteibacterium stylophorae TaxID=1776034 RepID=A0A8J7VXH6_9GAMM|nr:aldo/keto reductase [Coralloluteibacterium stylophorae]MBS7458725.1 aldo/keto reductase [Coralloluteibacterium stylophorae]
MPSRRSFLALGALAAAGAAFRPAFAAGSADAMRSRRIPASGQPLPVIGMGTSGSFAVEQGSAEYEALKEVLKRFFEGGGRLIDTSPNYQGADRILGALLEAGGWRDDCFLATKIAADDRAAAEAQWAQSLRSLRTDHVELLQIHNLRAWQTQLAYARELKAEGKTRYVGVTHYLESGHDELVRVVRAEKPDFLQINYSVTAPQAAETVFPVAEELGVAVIVNRAFDDGKLFSKVRDRPLPGWAAEIGSTSWAQLFLKFALSHPAVTVVIPATGKPHRQSDNLQAGSGDLLSDAQRQELIGMFR